MKEYTNCPSHPADQCCPWAGSDDGCGVCLCCLEGTAIYEGEAMPLEDAVHAWLGTRHDARAHMDDIESAFPGISKIGIHDGVCKLIARGGAVMESRWVYRVE